MKWQLTIPIVPVAKQSVRGGKFGYYQPKKKRLYQESVAYFVAQSKPPRRLQGALRLSAKFVFPYLKQHSKKARELGEILKTTRPDMDNLLKPLKDAMKYIVYDDDAQIAEYTHMVKLYGDEPRVEIRLEEISDGSI